MVIKWMPPSFDPKPSESALVSRLGPEGIELIEPPLQLPTIEEIEAIRKSAFQEGYTQGFQKGSQQGEAEGLQTGTAAGAQAGYQQAYDDAKADIDALTKSLQDILEALQGLPEAITQPLNELAYEIAMRISGKEQIDRGPFVAAIQEALMRLPRPGETLFLRISEADSIIWKRIVDDLGLPFSCSLLLDADVAPGHAFAELDHARIDVGFEARKAIARSLLGLSNHEHPLDEETY